MMDQASQMVDADDRLRHIGWSAAGRDRMIAKGLVRSFVIIVHERHGENFPQTGLAVADHLPEGQSFQGADEPLDVPIFPWAPRGRPLHGHTGISDHAPEPRSEQLVPVHLDGRSHVLGQEPNKRLLPFIEDLAKLTPADKAEYKRQLTKEPGMSIIEEWIAETKAEGELTAILHMVSKGRATVDAARAEIADLVAAGTITRAQADAALSKLG